MYELPCDDYIKVLIKYLTPDLFIGLNNGEIFKYFYESKKIEDSEDKFKLWLTLYNESISKFNYNLKNKNNYNHLFSIYTSMENYKKYICDMNILKDYNLLIDLVSKFNNINILIIDESKRNHIKLINPISDDINNIYNKNRIDTLLYKVGNIYEPLYEIEKNNVNKNVNESFVILNKTQTSKINKLKNIIINQNNYNTISFYNLESIIKDTHYDIQAIIVNRYFKGVGILTHDGLVIHTLPFSYKFNYDYIYEDKLPRLSIKDVIAKYLEMFEFLKLKITLTHFVIDNKKIHSIFTSNNKYIPVIQEKYESKKYNIDSILEEKYVENMDEILFNQILVEDERLLFNNSHELEKNIYNNLKFELAQFFKHNKSGLNKQIDFFIRNNVIPITIKRNKIMDLIKNILDNIVVFDKPTILNYSQNFKGCQQQTELNCNNTCKLSGDKKSTIVNFESNDYTIYVSECKFILNKSNYTMFYSAITEEIIKYYNKRNNILNGTYLLPYENVKKDFILFINGLNYIEKIRKLYQTNTYLYANNYYNYILNNKETIKVLKTSKFKVNPKVNYPKVNAVKVKSKFKVRSKVNSVKVKSKFKVRSKVNVPKVKSKFKVRSKVDVPKVKSKFKVRSKVDAVKLNTTLNVKPNVTSKDKLIIDADMKDIYGKDISKQDPKVHKSGKCVFPFKYSANWPIKSYTGKTLGKEYSNQKKMIEVNDCIPSKTKKYGYWCPTSLTPEKKTKTFAFCKKIHNKSSNNDNGNNSNGNNIIIKDRYAVKYRYDGSKKKKYALNAQKGKCIFPFKKTKKGPKIYDCIAGTKKADWCATERKPNYLYSKWGYCIPEGMTEEEYNNL